MFSSYFLHLTIHSKKLAFLILSISSIALGWGKCFVIDEITFLDTQKEASSLPKGFGYAYALMEGYKHSCIDTPSLNTLLKSLNDITIQKGYLTSRFGLKPQDLKSHKLEISFEPGRISKITYDYDGIFAFPKKDFSIKEGDILYLRDIEAGMHNLKSMRHITSQMEIIPAQKDGYSDVIIKARKKRSPISASYTLDNGNLQFDYEHIVLFAWENPLKLADKLQFYMLGSIPFDKSVKKNHSFYGSFSYRLPFLKFVFEESLSYSKSSYQIRLVNLTPAYGGYNLNNDTKLSYSILRNQNHDLSMGYDFGFRLSKSFLEDILLIAQDRKVVQNSLFLHYAYLAQSFSFSVDSSFLYGYSLANRLLDASHYFLPTLNLTLYYPFKIKSLDLSYISSIRTQVGSSGIYANDAFVIGGRYTVRGFDRLSYSGQIGVIYRNDLNLYIPLYKELKLVPSIGLDAGYVKDLNFSAQNMLSGGGAGISLVYKYFNIQGWWYVPLYSSSKRIATQNFFFSVGVNWG